MINVQIKELAPYLPYRIKIQVHGSGELFTLCSYRELIEYASNELSIQAVVGDFYVKPVLRLISDISLDEVRQLYGENVTDFRFANDLGGDFSMEILTEIGWSSLTFNEYLLLLSAHFDLFNLIKQGKAVDFSKIDI